MMTLWNAQKSADNELAIYIYIYLSLSWLEQMWLQLRRRLRAHLEDIFALGEGPKTVLVDGDTVKYLPSVERAWQLEEKRTA